MIVDVLAWLTAAAALVGALYALLAAHLTARFLARSAPIASAFPAVSLLKPLHRRPGRLAEALETFCAQDYPGEVQILFGVQDPADPAVGVVRALIARRPHLDIGLIVDPRVHGANRKVSNLIHLAAAAKHDVLILSDADVSVADDYLRTVVAALAEPGVGAVSLLYLGAPDAGLWSRLAAMAIDYAFLPNAILGMRVGLAQPCFGSTIALTRETLGRIGGFEVLRDRLADDYEIGAAVRRLGLAVAVPPLLVGHASHQASLGALIDHEIRWARTVRLIDPWGHAGSAITHPLPFALFAASLTGFSPAAWVLVLVVLGVRIAAKLRIDAITGARAGPWWLVPARDVLSFAVFLASFAGDTVVWQGRRFGVGRDGRLTPL